MSRAEKVISGEEHQKQMMDTKKSGGVPKIVIVVAGIMLLSGISFAGGVQYQKGKTKDAQDPARISSKRFGQNGGGPMRFQGGQRPSIGEVTAIDSSSITIRLARGGSSTFKITSDTKVTDDGATISVSDIKTGDTVLVQANSNDTTTASNILINPQMMTGPNNQTESSPSTDSLQGTDSI
jgi:hypothetical protein